MTVSTTHPIENYPYTGPGRYDFDALAYDEDTIRVFYTDTTGMVTEWAFSTDFTVTLNVGTNGGYIDTVPTETTGTISIRRILLLEQLTRWINNNSLDMPILEKSFDKIVMMAQQIQASVDDGSSTLNWRADWVTETIYYYRDMVVVANGNWYYCIIEHTASTDFATDLAAGYWAIALDISVIEGYADAAGASATAAAISAAAASLSAVESGTSAAGSLVSKLAAGLSEANSAINAQNSGNCSQSSFDSATDSSFFKNESTQYAIGENPLGTPNEPAGGSAKYWANQSSGTTGGGPDALTAAMIPTNWREVIRTGWTPAWFNQQWGGAPWGDAFEEVATGNTADSGNTSVITSGSIDNPIQVSRTINVAAVKIKLSKGATNPTTFTDVTATLNGQASVVDIRTLGATQEWHTFTFTTPPTLVAGTSYNLNVAFGGTSVYWSTTTPIAYPLGGDRCFQIIPTTSTADGKLNCYEGNPLNQSGAVTRKVQDVFVGDTLSYSFKADSITDDKPLVDMIYGLEQDRIHLSVASGVLVLKVYNDDGTLSIATGTTSVTGLNKTIGVVVALDRAEIWIDGTIEATTGATTISFSSDFKPKGTVIVGGGMPENVTWTKETEMSVLPSADGWTFTGTATEADAFSVNEGKLYQNKNGFGSTDIGYYLLDPVNFDNAIGWAVRAKVSSQSLFNRAVEVVITDGATSLIVNIQKNFVSLYDGSSFTEAPHQQDMSGSNEILIFGKGDDTYIFINGNLAIDGTGLHVVTSVNNKISFGDAKSTADSNSDAVWENVSYAESWNPSEYTSSSIYDLAFWSKDMSSIFPSVATEGLEKAIGLHKLPTVERVQEVRGIESEPTTTATSAVPMPNMNQFVLGEHIRASSNATLFQNTAIAYATLSMNIDGSEISNRRYRYGTTLNTRRPVVVDASVGSNYGLHFVEAQFHASAGTVTADGIQRNLITRSK